jgi:hypothetical protein
MCPAWNSVSNIHVSSREDDGKNGENYEFSVKHAVKPQTYI